MHRTLPIPWKRRPSPERAWRAPALRLLLAAWALCLMHMPVQAAGPVTLRARYEELVPALRHSPFGRPIHIESGQSGDTLQGEVYAVLDSPFDKVRDALRQPAHWCDIMILPFNVKYCHATQADGGRAELQVRVARRYDMPLDEAYRLVFDFRDVASTQDYFEARLAAPEGPVGTSDYHIDVAAIPLDEGHTFMRLAYSYSVGFTGRLAMQAYLSTAGADKVGFTRGQGGGFIGGTRGAIERNVMRYYLAVDAFLDSLSAPPQQRAERRIQKWFTEVERYPRQLHEMDRATYVEMKRREVRRLQRVID